MGSSVQLKWTSRPLQGCLSRPPGKWTDVRRTHNTNAAQWIIHDPVGLPLEENCTARASVYCTSSPLKLPVWCHRKWQHVGVAVTSTQQGHCGLFPGFLAQSDSCCSFVYVVSASTHTNTHYGECSAQKHKRCVLSVNVKSQKTIFNDDFCVPFTCFCLSHCRDLPVSIKGTAFMCNRFTTTL